MSIQRYDWTNRIGEAIPSAEGQFVMYADHVAALAEAQADLDHVSYVLGQTSERQRSVLLIADAYGKGVADERARIRQAVEELQLHDNTGDPVDDGYMQCFREVLSIIDGEDK